MAGPPAYSNIDFNNLKGVNVAAAVAATDVPQLSQVTSAATTAQTNAQSYTDSAISSLTSGQTLKGTVRAYTATNVNTGTPGSTIDGLTPANGDVFLLGGQTTGSQNGPWVWNGASTAMTRPTNWNSSANAIVGSYWIVREGTSQDSFALMTNDSFTFGTTTAVFKLVGIVQTPAATGYTELSPSTAAGGTWTVTHGLTLTAPPIVQVYRAASPYDQVAISVRVPSNSQVSISPDVALAAGDLRVVITKTV